MGACHVMCVDMLVGARAFHGIIILYRCKDMPRPEIKFLIHSRRDILKISSILVSFWSKLSILAVFDQNDPKIELVFQIRMHRSIRN